MVLCTLVWTALAMQKPQGLEESLVRKLESIRPFGLIKDLDERNFDASGIRRLKVSEFQTYGVELSGVGLRAFVDPESHRISLLHISYEVPREARRRTHAERQELANRLFQAMGYGDEQVSWLKGPEADAPGTYFTGVRLYRGVPYDSNHHSVEVLFDHAGRLRTFRARTLPLAPTHAEKSNNSKAQLASDLVSSKVLRKGNGSVIQFKSHELIIVSPAFPLMEDLNFDNRTHSERALGESNRGIYAYKSFVHVLDETGVWYESWLFWTNTDGSRIIAAKYLGGAIGGSPYAPRPEARPIKFEPTRILVNGGTRAFRRLEPTQAHVLEGDEVVVRSRYFAASGLLKENRLTVTVGSLKKSWLVDFK